MFSSKNNSNNMQIWYMEPYPCGDMRLPHHVYPPKTITLDQLKLLTGIQQYKVDLADTQALKKRISSVKTEKNCNASDMFVLSKETPDLDEKLENLCEPTVKTVDTVSLILDGSCYYDIEKEEDQWIRIYLEKGDFIIIPSGKNIRFTTTPQNYVKIQRFFNTSTKEK
ncbi:1,2-dihydroxy-3-keto-5-methylthiopentene dioxygenase [Strongyloides ratti]|uniref:1,2-dihydroxy-3-keto-5-methylthiopentene dioxygenase n=1 Tax=Strongyloides ratti TaxID=34506 RepID=A0A090KTK0_STRRB|nr:1,2-dihydroxy-3-keto-5-methylthiopentene dioxygenase [Strongyloides ratti]CEF60701.1 1,2-dihydroxy-3-keto-5-methylthiopentene dioxygenase [Strongyloides ratti]